MLDLGSTIFQTTNNQPQCCVQGGRIRQLLPLFLEAGDPLARAGDPRLKLVLIDEPVRITVDSSCDSLP